MSVIAKDKWISWSRRAALTTVAVILVVAAAATLLSRDRPKIGDINWQPLPVNVATEGTVTVTWLGTSTLLFDDGETQILIDGFISRPPMLDLLLRRPVESAAASVNSTMHDFQMRRLAAIIPVHSHFDHAMDIGTIANRSFASILGSQTTAQIAKGAGVPDDQILIAVSGAEHSFGNFTVTLIDSAHAPIGWGGSVPFAGELGEPLQSPAPISAWLAGESYSVVVAHPSGTTLVQGSAGFVDSALQNVRADVVFLGVGQLRRIGHDYAEKYWQQLVTVTGAKHVIAVHFDDFSQPFGTTVLPPRIFDNFVITAGWLEVFRDTWDTDTRLHLPVFGVPIVLYPGDLPDV